jgi:hypothetical protein
MKQETKGQTADNYMKIPSGSNIPTLGMALDASYDQNYDDVVPGYKILSVAVGNNSINIIQMDKMNDKWVLIDSRGAKHKAILNLREESPDVYGRLPEKLRGMLEYPLMIQVGETHVIDLLFKKDVKLESFRSLQFISSIFGKTFEIVPQD